MVWLQRLPFRVALLTLSAGSLGALAAAFFVLDVSSAAAAEQARIAVALGIVIVAATMGATFWAIRQARTLRDAAYVATSALSGRAVAVTTRSASNESVVVANAVNALVERAERNTRELSQRQAYAAVGDFATELARELAPSVQSARTSLRALETNLHTDSPLHPPLARALRELHRLTNTLQDTLRLARSGKLASRTIDLWIPLRAAHKTAATDASARRIWMEPPPHGKAPIWVHGDADALEQLFLNLLVNAVQATESGGRVEIKVDLTSDATITITDTGCGIPEGALDRVFEPFYSTKADRAGLGLAIAWRTAAAHGGKLSIESALNRGTVVHVALPIATGAASFELA